MSDAEMCDQFEHENPELCASFRKDLADRDARVRANAFREAADWLTAEYPGPGLDAPIRRAAARLRAFADRIQPEERQ